MWLVCWYEGAGETLCHAGLCGMMRVGSSTEDHVGWVALLLVLVSGAAGPPGGRAQAASGPGGLGVTRHTACKAVVNNRIINLEPLQRTDGKPRSVQVIKCASLAIGFVCWLIYIPGFQGRWLAGTQSLFLPTSCTCFYELYGLNLPRLWLANFEITSIFWSIFSAASASIVLLLFLYISD